MANKNKPPVVKEEYANGYLNMKAARNIHRDRYNRKEQVEEFTKISVDNGEAVSEFRMKRVKKDNYVPFKNWLRKNIQTTFGPLHNMSSKVQKILSKNAS